jgi:parallel beta-helix repeat protein
MKRAAILAVLVSSVLAVTPLTAKAPLHVDDDGAQRPGAYLDIETALADAVVGDTILVHEGVYPGAINVLTDRVALRTVGNAVLDAATFPPPPWGDAGIVVQEGVSGVTIQGLEIRGFGAGIVVGLAAHDNVVKSNTVSDSPGVGIVLADTAAANSIVGNEVTHSGFGIVLDPASSANSVVGNVISLCGTGIVLVGANDNKVRENRITDSTASGLVLVDASAGNELVGNVVTASGGMGITVFANDNVVKDNQVMASGLTHWAWKDGIRILGDDNEIKDNDVYDSREDGIAIRGNRNLVVDNKVFLSGRYGIGMLSWISGTNDNLAKDNVVYVSMLFDLFDDCAGTGNVWRENQYETANFCNSNRPHRGMTDRGFKRTQREKPQLNSEEQPALLMPRDHSAGLFVFDPSDDEMQQRVRGLRC